MSKPDDLGFLTEPFNFKQWNIVAFVAFVISISVFVISIILLTQFPNFVESNIRQASILTNNSDLFEKWQSPQYSILTSISVFSVRNPDEIMNNSKPSMKLTGPYVFNQKIRRLVHSIENGTVKFETFRSYFFNEEMSCPECFLYNQIWVPNLIYQKFVEVASKPTIYAANHALLVQKPFLEVEVAELLFQGYTDPFLDKVCNLPFINFVCKTILNLPERIGFFFEKNGTTSGIVKIKNGEEDGGKSLGKIVTWNGKSSMLESWWSSSDATVIRGTDGELFKPYIDKKENLTVFVSDLCRNLKLTFVEELDYYGISAFKFVVPASEFDFTLQENKGYCNVNSGKRFYDKQDEHCLPNGLLDISRCQQGEPPVVISMSNFLYAPDYVQKSVDGLRQPAPELDQIEVLFEPRLGVVLEAHRRFQINIAMWKGVNLSHLKNFRSTIVPVILIDEKSRIDLNNLEEIKTKLIYVENGVKVVTISALICSILAAFLVVLYAVHRKSGSPVNNFIREKIKRNNVSFVGGVGHSEC